jgi:Kef-type K+ transport system membrane component KefB
MLKLPTIPIEIILGSVGLSIGVIHPNHIFDLVAELGFLYLMFLAGLEVDLRALMKISTEILQKAFLYTIILYILSTIVSVYYFDYEKIFIVTLPLISIGLLASLKKEYGEQVWLNMAITVGLIGEIISIVVLTTVSAGLKFGIGVKFYQTLVLLFTLFIVVIIIYRLFHNLLWWHPELKTKLMPKVDTQEQDIRISMAVFFLMIAAMLYLHLEIALGTFIAGVFITTFFKHNKELPHKLEHFGFGWLVPIFFIWIGTKFELSSLFIDNLVLTALVIAIIMIAIRVIASTLFIVDIGYRNSFLLAISHAQPLTLLIAVVTLAYQAHSITQFYFFTFILASIFEVIISMILIKIVHK